MKAAQIYTTHAVGPDFGWRWRSADGKEQSSQGFAYYHDCVEDARKRGYLAQYDGAGVIDVPDLGSGHQSI